jgi:predicted RNA-binding Zn-ribbon protein involved in translation (DUF1610 family)
MECRGAWNVVVGLRSCRESMNTRQKIALIFAAESGVHVLLLACGLVLSWKGIVPVWALLAVFALSPIYMVPVTVLGRRFNKRFEAAKLRGRTLCSRCEYEIPETSEKIACPECGVVRSAKEHRDVMESWNLWKS